MDHVIGNSFLIIFFYLQPVCLKNFYLTPDIQIYKISVQIGICGEEFIKQLILKQLFDISIYLHVIFVIY